MKTFLKIGVIVPTKDKELLTIYTLMPVSKEAWEINQQSHHQVLVDFVYSTIARGTASGKWKMDISQLWLEGVQKSKVLRYYPFGEAATMSFKQLCNRKMVDENDACDDFLNSVVKLGAISIRVAEEVEAT